MWAVTIGVIPMLKMARRSATKRDDDGGLMSDLARARLDRIKGGGLSGMQAGTIGTVLVGFIIAGVLLGGWLDKRFNTSFWLPVMAMLGVAAGFREMFVTLRQVDLHARREKAEREANRQTHLENSAPSPLLRASDDVAAAVESENAPQPQPRVFKVPAPPQASFDKNASAHMSTHAAGEDVRNDDRSLTDQLLDLNDDRPSSQ